MNYRAYTVTKLPGGTSDVSPVLVQTSAQFGSAVAACLAITLSTSVPAPNAVTSFRSITTHKARVERPVFFFQETERDDLLAIARIRELGTYQAGWAGTESVGPTRTTVEHAEEFARYIFGLGKIEVPYISASSDGEINFYWKRDGFTLDLGFTGNGFYSYYAQLPDGQEIIEDAASLDKPLPENVIDLLTQNA